jgi:F0F1-type ATP synthase assembly protein I
MLRFDVLQNQWLILALVGGSALVLAVVLSYLALWRGQGGAEEADAEAPAEHGRMPWILVLVYAATVLFGILYVLARAVEPPNW